MPENNSQTPQAPKIPQTLPTSTIATVGVALLIPVIPVFGIPLALHALSGAAIGGLTFAAASLVLGPSREKLLNITELLPGKSSEKPSQEIESPEYVASPELIQSESSEAVEVIA